MVNGHPAKKTARAVPSNVKKLGTKAAQIRQLARMGWSDGDIARAMGISHQHAYNTTHRATKDFKPAKYGR